LAAVAADRVPMRNYRLPTCWIHTNAVAIGLPPKAST
jgi:hypothetical protein